MGRGGRVRPKAPGSSEMVSLCNLMTGIFVNFIASTLNIHEINGVSRQLVVLNGLISQLLD
jgi:hypothetical protein